jgi:trehalose dimycolate hydrolase
MVRVTSLRPWARLASIAAAAMSSAAIVTVGPAPVSAAAPCPDVQIVFARGTSEPPGIGRMGQALVDALRPQLGGRSVGTYAVDYPATYDFLTAADGAFDATAHMTSLAQQCPATRIVLGGYSQGAAVVDMLGGIPPLGKRIGEMGSAPPLPATLAGNVAAVAVFGNPSTKFGNPVSVSQLFGGRAIDLCKKGDPICSDGRNPFAHDDYISAGLTNEAADFVAGLV